MDQVSKILTQRERAAPRIVPFVALALIGHASVAAGLFFISHFEGERTSRISAVGVNIVRPSAPKPRLKKQDPPPGGGGDEVQPSPAPVTPRPRKTTVPATPRPRKTSAPVPSKKAVATKKPARDDANKHASADAMGRHDATPGPQPTHTPEPVSGSGDGPGQGSGNLGLGTEAVSLSTGEGGDTGTPSDFRYTNYVDRMCRIIDLRWEDLPAPAGTKAKARFRILKNGKIVDITLEEESGIQSFDRAVKSALRAASPLPPLPATYGKQSVTVHLTFAKVE